MMVSFIKENTYFASYPYEVFLYLKYQQSTKSCACDKSHWQNILRMCQRVRERSHASISTKEDILYHDIQSLSLESVCRVSLNSEKCSHSLLSLPELVSSTSASSMFGVHFCTGAGRF